MGVNKFKNVFANTNCSINVELKNVYSQNRFRVSKGNVDVVLLKALNSD